MGLIPSSLDGEFAEAEAITGGGTRWPTGVRTVTIENAELGPSPKPWIDTQLSITLADPDGSKDFINMEVAPLTLKDGTISKGKLGFLKGQLQKMGYPENLTLSALEFNLDKLKGAVVVVQVTNDPQTDAAGNVKLKPNSDEPWTNHEIKVQELVSASPMVSGSTASVPTGAPAPSAVVY